MTTALSPIDAVARDFAKARLRHYERLRYTHYTEPDGHPSIGWGHHYNKIGDIPEPITFETAEELLATDFAAAATAACAHPAWSGRLAPPRQAALIDLAYNMGAKWWTGFPACTQALQQNEYHQAALALLKSQYAKQVPTRASENATMIYLATYCWL